MYGILLISLLAFVVFLVLTGFGTMRDFSRLWIQHSRKVFCGTHPASYYGELAVILLTSLLIAVSASLLKGAVTILLGLAFTDSIAEFTTALRGTFSAYTTELQNSKHYILFWLLNPALKLLAVWGTCNGIRVFFHQINKKAGGACFDESDVLYFSSLSVLFLITSEMAFHIQDILWANNMGNIAYLVLDKYSYVVFFLTVQEVTMFRKHQNRLEEAFDKYLITRQYEKNILHSGWKILFVAYLVALLLSTPYFLGLQWMKENHQLIGIFLIVMACAYLLMKKVFSTGWNLAGTVLFATTLSSPLGSTHERKPNRAILPVLVISGGIMAAFGIAFPKELFMLAFLLIVAAGIIAVGIVIVYFVGYLAGCFRRNNAPSSSHRNYSYPAWVLAALPRALAASTATLIVAFMAVTLFPKDMQLDEIFDNTSVVDSGGNWLYIDESADHLLSYAPVKYDELPPSFVEMLAIQEDRGFFRQNDLLPNKSNWHGFSFAFFKGRGGSNLNAQLVKNICFIDAPGFPRDIARKASEQISSYMIGRRHTPEEIMEAYVNIVSFHGSFDGFRGINGASLYAFGLPINKLSPLQQLYLIHTLPRSSYVKVKNERIAYNKVQKDSTGIVKRALLSKAAKWYNEGLITESRLRAFQRESLNFTNCRYRDGIPASTRLMLERAFKDPGRHVTTITLGNEKALARAYSLLKEKDVYHKNGAELQVAALVVDKRGEIVGHFSSSDLVDYANDYTYPIGSVGKPPIVLSILEAGMPGNFTLYDGQVDGRKTPRNSSGGGWSNAYVGINSILPRSLNAPFRNIDLLGLNPSLIFKNVESAYNQMEIGGAPDIYKDVYNYPLGLREMTLSDVATIYSTLNNDGAFVPLTLEQRECVPQGIRIWEASHTSLVRDAMRMTIDDENGTLHKYKKDLPQGRDYFGKTGTSTRQRDGWTVLCDGDRVVVCWASYGRKRGDHISLGVEPLWGGNTAGLFATLIYNELNR